MEGVISVPWQKAAGGESFPCRLLMDDAIRGDNNANRCRQAARRVLQRDNEYQDARDLSAAPAASRDGQDIP